MGPLYKPNINLKFVGYSTTLPLLVTTVGSRRPAFRKEEIIMDLNRDHVDCIHLAQGKIQ
jgi:hypothetical protein